MRGLRAGCPARALPLTSESPCVRSEGSASHTAPSPQFFFFLKKGRAVCEGKQKPIRLHSCVFCFLATKVAPAPRGLCRLSAHTLSSRHRKLVPVGAGGQKAAHACFPHSQMEPASRVAEWLASAGLSAHAPALGRLSEAAFCGLLMQVRGRMRGKRKPHTKTKARSRATGLCLPHLSHLLFLNTHNRTTPPTASSTSTTSSACTG